MKRTYTNGTDAENHVKLFVSKYISSSISITTICIKENLARSNHTHKRDEKYYHNEN